jgi:hypothetical protein
VLVVIADVMMQLFIRAYAILCLRCHLLRSHDRNCSGA